MKAWLPALVLLFASACAEELGPPDAMADAEPAEFGLPDRGSEELDASLSDAGEREDLSGPDLPDAFAEDAGTPEDAGEPSFCSVGGATTECVDVTSCVGSSFLARCPGPPREVCCFEAPSCSVRGAPGLCIDVATCTASRTAGLCPGPANIQCCARSEDECDPLAEPRPNEGLEEESYDLACPDGMVSAGTFCIDRFEASLVLVAGGSWSPFSNPGSTAVRAVSLPYAIPQAYISGVQAAGACEAAGKRLCTDSEWLSACRGPSERTYPYGNTREAGRCNDARTVHPAVEYFGSNDPSVFTMLGHHCINQIPSSLALTGARAGCESEVGAFDMMGNLHEWTADPAGTFRGGFYVDTRLNGEGCLYLTTAHDVAYADYSTGFRCCAELR